MTSPAGDSGRSYGRPALVMVAALAISAALPATSFAAPSSSSLLATGATSATLVLRTPVSSAPPVGHPLTRAEQLARVEQAAPTLATRASVVASAVGLGLTVDHSGPWTVAVHGKAAAIARLARSGRPTGSLVSAAPALAPGVANVVLAGQRVDWRPALQQPHSGADFRAAYDASSTAPPVGALPPVIATLQFSGWDSSELAGEASNLGLPTPTPGVFTAVSVDGASTTLDDGTDGSGEVALDQESIYATDPYADQRAYFAGQLDTNELDAYYAIAQDALSPRGIMALSISWDSCENSADLHNSGVLSMLQQALATVVSAGVTVFAASGDSGPKCADGSLGVSFPASDPLVVAVGGTTLTAGPTETAWGAVAADPPADIDGSGGGVSQLFARPAYQAAVAPASAWREVPDIAADGDPQTGFPVYHDDGTGTLNFLDGGTSLSSPISAALMVAELGSRGITTGGVGDIHQVLYSAPATSFRDITSGGVSPYLAAPGYDLVTGLGSPNWQLLVNQMLVAPTLSAPAVSASRTVPVTVTVPSGLTVQKWSTGYGTPPACGNSDGKPATAAPVQVPTDGHFQIWAEGYTSRQTCLVASTSTTVDTTGPVAQLSAKATSSAARAIRYAWSVADLPSGVTTVLASVTRNGKPIWTSPSQPTGFVTLPGKPGSLYQLVLVAKDTLGNSSRTTRDVSVAFDDRSFALSGKWSRASSNAAFGGSVVSATRKGAAAHLSAYGSTFSLKTRTCPTCGAVGIYVDGKHVRDVSLYSKAVRTSVALKLATVKTVAAHRIVLVVRGTKPAHSKGSTVFVDGLLAT